MLTVGDIMTRKVVTVKLDDTLLRIREIFDECFFHHLVVVKGRQVVGVISDRELLKNLSPFVDNEWMERRQDVNTLKRKAHQIMRRSPIVTGEKVSVAQATAYLLAQKVTCLPVVDGDDNLRGIVTWRDLLPHCTFCDLPQDEAA